ncbi:sensor histidine kinase [Actinomycetospora lemnae]|uniref:Sensor histidine kinase n=1 Tax=Actinomycetospora lemnae TaxID=3019891 RepID=A0ABT5SRC7_9PSEU|nr:sensor histidine kinase [Actinomycetospora sp. DW7H6]MDD7965015.1 sensor histidine kinase [Actinomycetospora sp. DW7H6]
MRPTTEQRASAEVVDEPEAPPPLVTAEETGRARDLLLGLIALAGLVVLALCVALAVRHRDVVTGPDEGGGIIEILAGPVLLAAGLLVLRGADPRGRPVGWVLTAAGAGWLLTGLASAWIVEGLYVTPGLPGTSFAYAVSARYGAFLLLALPLVILLFPDGRLPRGRIGRPVALASLAGTALLPLVLLVVPSREVEARSGMPFTPRVAALDLDPHSIPLPFWPQLLGVAFALVPLGMVVPFVVVAVRHHRARGRRRLQLRWLVWAGLVDVLLVGVGVLLPAPWPTLSLLVAITVTSGAIATAAVRERLYEIDRLLPTTVVALALGVLVLAVDGLVLLVAGAAFGGRDSALLAVAVVAVLYTPLRSRLWRAARRLTRGSRDDPYAAVATLAGRLETAAAPGEQLAALARSVAEAFRLPYVRVEIDRADGAQAVVEHGHTDRPTVALPIRYRDETIGRVAVAEGRRLSEADQRLLGDLLRQAAGAARAGALSASLQQARVDLVTAREEERRRLRRDLHDSVGPGLGAVTLRIETARGLAATDPAAADGVLAQAVADVGALLTDVRRLVHDLRPPALDELGLAGALRAQARRLSDDGLEIVVDGEPGELPAAVEVAAFRIASEAVTNVVRHAGASRAIVLLERRPGRLVVTVTDDGRGIGADVVAGVGTLSLRERAAELGGRTSVSCPPDGGTVVAAEIPLEDP